MFKFLLVIHRWSDSDNLVYPRFLLPRNHSWNWCNYHVFLCVPG